MAGATVSFIGAGTCVVNANQAGNANYNAAPQVQRSFAVGKGSQTISLTTSVPDGAILGDAPYTVSATVGSGLEVSFSIDASASGICSIRGATVSFDDSGTCVINANQAGHANWNPAAQQQQSFIIDEDGGGEPGDDVNVGAYHLDGSCGILGLQRPGFTLTASSGATGALPLGTSVLVTGSGVPNIGVSSVSGGSASLVFLSNTSRMITLTSALPAGVTIAFRTTLSISVAFTLNAVTSLPTGFVETGAKPVASVSSTLILCSGT